eukprot:8377073-Pyramimonas_sp.AAC.1
MILLVVLSPLNHPQWIHSYILKNSHPEAAAAPVLALPRMPRCCAGRSPEALRRGEREGRGEGRAGE